MLQNIRDNSQGWIAKTIIGVIVILLALTGVEAIFNVSGRNAEVVEVNGQPITQTELNQAVAMQRDQLAQQLGAQFDPSLLNDQMLRESALRNLIDRTLLLQAAAHADFAFSEAALDQIILQTPEFQVEGRFDPNRFDQVLQRMGYSRMQFRDMLRSEMLIGQLQAGIAGSAFVTDEQIAAFARLEGQTRDFRMAKIPASPEQVAVLPEEVQTYYEANADQYRSPEQVVAEYVLLEKESFFGDVEADEEELRALYEKQVANLAEQRRAAHILIEVGDETSDEQAQEKIRSLKAELENGADFNALAKKASEDPGSAGEGGDLGFSGPGVYDPAFEKALYALNKGEVSEPVRSEFGWHLIKLLDVQSPEVPTFDAMRPELERQLKAEQVEQHFVDARRQLEASAFESPDLAQPAQELGLQVQTTAPFGRDGGEGVTSNKQFIQAAFGEQALVEGVNSALIELDPETVAVLRVKEHRKPEVLPLDQVRDRIVQQLKREKAAEQAQAKGEAMLTQLKAGEKPVADAPTVEWKTVEAADRGYEGVEPQVLQRVFRMPRPAADEASYAGVSLPNGDFVLVQLEGVNEPERVLDDKLKQDYRRFLASRMGQQDFSALMNHLRETADIDRR